MSKGRKYRVLSTNPNHVPEYNKYSICCCKECTDLFIEEMKQIKFVETRKATREELDNAAKHYPHKQETVDKTEED